MSRLGQPILWGVPPPSPRARFEGGSALDLIGEESDEDLADKLRPGRRQSKDRVTGNTADLTRHLLAAGML